MFPFLSLREECLTHVHRTETHGWAIVIVGFTNLIFCTVRSMYKGKLGKICKCTTIEKVKTIKRIINTRMHQQVYQWKGWGLTITSLGSTEVLDNHLNSAHTDLNTKGAVHDHTSVDTWRKMNVSYLYLCLCQLLNWSLIIQWNSTAGIQSIGAKTYLETLPLSETLALK